MTWEFDLQLFGGDDTSGMTDTANKLMGQQQGLFNQILAQLSPGGGYGSIANSTQGLLGPLSGIFGSMMGPGGAAAMTPQMMQQYMTLANSPQALAAFTGINAPGLMQHATNYLNRPGQTNLAGMVPGAMGQLAPGQSALGLGGSQAADFYRGEMQNGLNPQFAQNAQNQLQQQFGTSVSDIMSRAAPGQNTGAMLESAQNQLLSSSANLGGQLAGMGQQYANQGAQGLVGTTGAMDQNTLARIMGQYQMAGGLDAQKMQMLTQGAQMGSAYNQQQLGNVGQGAGMGMQALQGIQGLGQLGVGMNQFGMGAMQNMGNTLGTEGMDFTQLAAQIQASQPNPWALGAQVLGGAAGSYLGGGMKMPGKGGGGSGAPSMNAMNAGANQAGAWEYSGAPGSMTYNPSGFGTSGGFGWGSMGPWG